MRKDIPHGLYTLILSAMMYWSLPNASASPFVHAMSPSLAVATKQRRFQPMAIQLNLDDTIN